MDAVRAGTSRSRQFRGEPDSGNTDQYFDMFRPRPPVSLRPGSAGAGTQTPVALDQKLFSNDDQMEQLQELLRLGQVDDALALAQKLVRRYPVQGFAWHVLGALCLQRGRVDEAVNSLKTAIVLLPANAEAYNNYGCALERQGRLIEAELSYQHAIRLDGQFAQAYHNLGVVQRALGRSQESYGNLYNAIQIKPDYANAHFNLGLTLKALKRFEDAEQHFRIALKIRPDHVLAMVALGNNLASFGRFAEADTQYQNALLVDPENLPAWSAKTEIGKMRADDQVWLATAKKIQARPMLPREASRFHFSMGKYFDDVGEYSQAFAHFQRANDLNKRIAPGYDAARESSQAARICAMFDQAGVTRLGGSATDRPVFIVGMPRSGTSLAEHILAAHAQVAGAGELDFWSNAMAQLLATQPGRDIDTATIRYLADVYQHELRQVSPDTLRVIDKAPENFRNIGLIHAIFPNARFIHMQRDPVDTCLSIYFQDFASNFRYANDLSNLHHYYREYLGLMAHWRAVLPAGVLLDVPYHELVADQNGWTRRMVAFLGLEWDERCLQFQDVQRKVDTASQWQVRQRMYPTSVGRSRNYEAWLSPLLALRNAASS